MIKKGNLSILQIHTFFTIIIFILIIVMGWVKESDQSLVVALSMLFIAQRIAVVYPELLQKTGKLHYMLIAYSDCLIMYAMILQLKASGLINVLPLALFTLLFLVKILRKK